MGVAAFFLLALVSAGIIALPLVRSRSGEHATAVTEGVIDRAVRDRLRARKPGGLLCPGCGRAHEPGDRFCVGCGARLPETALVPAALSCPSCGAGIRPGDRFCPKCGAAAPVQEAS